MTITSRTGARTSGVTHHCRPADRPSSDENQMIIEGFSFMEEGIVLGWPGDDLLSRVLRHSTISAEAFNGRVRDGIGFRRLAPVTGPAKDNATEGSVSGLKAPGIAPFRSQRQAKRSFLTRPRTWTMRGIKPIERLVPVSSTRCRACTPGLSTWSSSTALKGVLVSRWVSRLDAFSGYPVRT